MIRRPAPWRIRSRAACPGCRRTIAALRSPLTGNLLLVAHHRPRTHIVCTPSPGCGVGDRWWAHPSQEATAA
jgi:hypothetical protein